MVPEFFDMYKRNAPPEISEFIKYLEKNYMKVNSIYPPSMWAGIYSTTIPTTTNGCESFHSAFGRLFGEGTTHPNIFCFLENLIFYHQWKKIKFTSPSPPKPQKNIDLLNSLRREEIGLWDFLRSINCESQPPNIK